MEKKNETTRVTTGIEGLDEILYGGLIPNRSYVIRGGPGTGKTTLGMEFLYEGLRNDEKSLLITLAEDVEKILEDFRNKFGVLLENIEVLDLSPSANIVTENKNYTLFEPQEVEWEELLVNITSKFEEVKPKRIFLDGITQLEYISNNKYEYRKNLLSLVNYTKELNATTLISSEAGEYINDEDLQFICDGIFNLEYQNTQRNLTIKKFRNSNFSQGKHSVKLTSTGMIIYPVLKIDNLNKRKYTTETISSGISSLDKLLKGGLEKGTSNIFSGPSGVGKTTLGIQFIKETSQGGSASILYNFEESLDVIINRCEAINISIKQLIENKKFMIKNITPIEYSPNEFLQLVKKDIQENDISLVMIDSITGFRLLFQEDIYSERDIIRHLHSLINYLTNENITVIMINEIASIMGNTFRATDYGISYLADNIIFLRYLEINGKMKKSIGVLKKRLSDYENSLRKFKITKNGIIVGDPLLDLRGILTGNPEYIKEKQE